MLGENAKEYSTYISTILLYIGLANIISIFGMKPPTKDMNVTIALALMSIILIEISGIRAKGMKGWIKSFTQPVAVVTPINILEVFTRPLSLCMRLFGNVIGAFVIMEMIKMVVPSLYLLYLACTLISLMDSFKLMYLSFNIIIYRRSDRNRII